MSTNTDRWSAASVRQRRTARLLVLTQALLLAVLAALPRDTDWPVQLWLRRTGTALVMTGAGIAAVAGTALGRGLTAVPLPNAHAQLRTGGLYRWVRHPIYSGVLLAAAGRGIGSGNRWALLVVGALTGLLTGKARFEERHLAARFPGYPAYAARTPRFVPHPLPGGHRPTAGRT